MEPWQRLSGADFARWIAAYNIAPLLVTNESTAANIEALKRVLQVDSSLVVCSSLSRSRDSAALLHLQPTITDALFREAELPVINCRWPKLSASSWLVLNRMLWFAGLANNVESFVTMKRRANLAAARLMTYAAEHPQVALIGHGVFNTFVAKALLTKGMRGPKKSANHYWGYSVYEK